MSAARILTGLAEAVSVARGETPAARIHVQGHAYVPEQRWQPIETAPRDGTVILICDTEGAGTVWASAWNPLHFRNFPWMVFDGTADMNGLPDMPTLVWQSMPRMELPLPAPPANE